MTEVQEFQIGQMVNVKNVCTNKHHRVPLYLKGKIGKVTEYLGLVENPEQLLTQKQYLMYTLCIASASSRQAFGAVSKMGKFMLILLKNGFVKWRCESANGT